MFATKATPEVGSNIRLGWKGLPGTNTLAYYTQILITTVKSFITLTPGQSFPLVILLAGANFIKLFTVVSYDFS
jgi:hypothetical protein